MRNRAAILVRPGPDDQAQTARFLAILCFIEFYYGFVTAGTLLWRASFEGHNLSQTDVDWDFFWNCMSLLTACSIYAVGRALWRESRTARWWAALSAALLMVGIVHAMVDPPWQHWAFTLPTWGRPWLDLMFNCWNILWLGIMVVLWRNKLFKWVKSWRILAVCWCGGVILFSILAAMSDSVLTFLYDAGLGVWVKGDAVRDLLPFLPRWAGVFALMAPLFTAGALIARWRMAALFALLTAALEAAPMIGIGYSLASLTYRAIQALIASTPPSKNPISWSGILWNQSTFECWAVDAVRIAAPWLLIAWFALRSSTSDLPDDGSPWPRRYCEKCFYNLHGVEADRCPECGATLTDGPPAGQLVTAKNG